MVNNMDRIINYLFYLTLISAIMITIYFHYWLGIDLITITVK